MCSVSSYYEKILATGEVKCIDDEVPFEIPQGWEWCKINNIAFVTKLAGFEYTKYIAGNLKPNGIPLFKGKNVQGGKIIYEFEAYIPESLSNELERSQISKKCLLTPYVGTIGNIGLHYKSGKFHLGSNVGKIEILNPSFQVCLLEEFVHIYLLSRYGYAELTKYKKATAQESISIEAIRDVLLPIPPIQEQQKIVDKYYQLETFLDKYRKSQECLDTLNVEIFDKFKKSILQEAIQGKLVPQIAEEGTAQELLEQIKAEKLKLVKEGKLKKTALNDSVIFRGDANKYYEQVGIEIVDITGEIPFPIPANWQWVRIRDVFQLNPKNEADDETLAAFIPMEKISAGYKSDFTFDLVKWGNIKKGFTHFANGDVAFAKITPCFQNRKSAIFHDLPNGIGAGTTELKVLRPYGNTIGRWYLLYFLESPYFIDEATFKGTANQQRIVVGYLENKLFPLPPRKQQQRIVAQIEKLFEQLH